VPRAVAAVAIAQHDFIARERVCAATRRALLFFVFVLVIVVVFVVGGGVSIGVRVGIVVVHRRGRAALFGIGTRRAERESLALRHVGHRGLLHVDGLHVDGVPPQLCIALIPRARAGDAHVAASWLRRRARDGRCLGSCLQCRRCACLRRDQLESELAHLSLLARIGAHREPRFVRLDDLAAGALRVLHSRTHADVWWLCRVLELDAHRVLFATGMRPMLARTR